MLDAVHLEERNERKKIGFYEILVYTNLLDRTTCLSDRITSKNKEIISKQTS